MKNEYLRLSSQLNMCELCNCAKGYVDDEDCSWYHQNWITLRQLDLVSNPFWHEHFFKQHLVQYTLNTEQKILVLGTADFSMPYFCKLVGINKLDISDICLTPLKICETVAKREGFCWNIFTSDIHKGINNKYDLVTNDAFLTRFNYDVKTAVLTKIGQLLNPGGKYITTIRKGWNDGKPLIPSKTEKEAFICKAVELACEGSKEAAGNAARQYIERMLSYPIKDEGALYELCDGIFAIENIAYTTLPGECVESTYIEVVFSKK